VTASLSKRSRDLIDVFGHVFFLIPFALLSIYMAIPFFLASLTSWERSNNTGGLVIWPAKFIILAGFVLVLAQGISELIKRIAILRGDIAGEQS
jgi:TRAP-type mannitol/chloroaromatic compound transport system permease small subunit